MLLMKIHTSDLIAFVHDIDRRGGVSALPPADSFQIRYDTTIDQTLDPFSEEYFGQQVALYRELAGREVDQETGEQTDFDMAAHETACNPYNSADVKFVADHFRAILNGLALVGLPTNPSILDLGCGWGVSAELFAYCGARVTAVDINRRFVDLVRRRAKRTGLPIDAFQSNFDSYQDDRRYDLLFFYECLHHSLKPWETLARLTSLLHPEGKILWAAEPVNTYWWRNWGMRLDPISIYCIRKFGWWESGWSEEFISRCFSKVKFDLTFHRGLGLNGGVIGVATRSDGPTHQPPDGLLHLASTDTDGQIAALHRHIADMQSSLSWKLMAPLRWAGQKARARRRR